MTRVLNQALALASGSFSLVERVLPVLGVPPLVSSFVSGPTSSFYRTRWGSTAGSFLEKEILCCGKTEWRIVCMRLGHLVVSTCARYAGQHGRCGPMALSLLLPLRHVDPWHP
jgi:hypothetical protein